MPLCRVAPLRHNPADAPAESVKLISCDMQLRECGPLAFSCCQLEADPDTKVDDQIQIQLID